MTWESSHVALVTQKIEAVPLSMLECVALVREPDLIPLPRWLPQAEGFQRTALLKAGPKAHTPGCDGIEESRARLRAYDVVGVTGCLPLLLFLLVREIWRVFIDFHRFSNDFP